MNLVLRERRQSGDKSNELKNLIGKTENSVAINLKHDSWHEMILQLKGDTVKVYLNSVFQLEHQSPGFAHPTKRNIAVSVPKDVTIDMFQVWDEAGRK